MVANQVGVKIYLAGYGKCQEKGSISTIKAELYLYGKSFPGSKKRRKIEGWDMGIVFVIFWPGPLYLSIDKPRTNERNGQLSLVG